MLTQHLHEVPPRVEYSMTAAGEELLEALNPLGDWATKHITLICTAEAG
jgi:DNA-binding HxlR family transcriptional regulator